MCGRIVLSSSPRDLAEMFHLDVLPDLQTRYNIAPMTDIAAVVRRPDADGLALRMMRWGLVPAWAKDPGLGARMINARSETVADKPAFREAFARRRCLIPVDAFYEWQKIGDRKQPFAFRARNGATLALAGLWDRWKDPDGTDLETCTIMTTAANGIMAPIHHRMPVILPEGDRDLWLNLDQDQKERLAGLLRPCPDDLLTVHPVSTAVNRPVFDEPACLDPVELPDEPGQMDLF